MAHEYGPLALVGVCFKLPMQGTRGIIMNLRLLTVLKWLTGAIVFLAFSYAVSRGFVLTVLHWDYGSVAPWFAKAEISRMGGRVFGVCLFWGALYASALAKPAAFGHIRRIFKHLGWSYLLGILGCVILARMALLTYPELETMFELRAYFAIGLGISALCFVSALAVWVDLAFAGRKSVEGGAAEPAQPAI